MKHYWCFLCVIYKIPRLVRLAGQNEAMRVEGYWQRLGVTAHSGTELRRVIRKYARDGRVSWKSSTMERIHRYEPGMDPRLHEIWYRGGLLYFTQ